MGNVKGFTHDNKNNATVDWYTPPWIFKRLCIEFDLDPCHPEAPIPWIPAKKTYSLRENGLMQPWAGRVWLNPPYGKYTPDWLYRMHIHRNGIALVFSRTDCAWFHEYVAKADAILFLRGRVKFVDGLGVTGGSGAGCGSMLVAWGRENVDALLVMQDLGYVHTMKIFNNKIRFNCDNYHRIAVQQPDHCYNCGMRDGYPQNLGGDKQCLNFNRGNVNE